MEGAQIPPGPQRDHHIRQLGDQRMALYAEHARLEASNAGLEVERAERVREIVRLQREIAKTSAKMWRIYYGAAFALICVVLVCCSI